MRTDFFLEIIIFNVPLGQNYIVCPAFRLHSMFLANLDTLFSRYVCLSQTRGAELRVTVIYEEIDRTLRCTEQGMLIERDGFELRHFKDTIVLLYKIFIHLAKETGIIIASFL